MKWWTDEINACNEQCTWLNKWSNMANEWTEIMNENNACLSTKIVLLANFTLLIFLHSIFTFFSSLFLFPFLSLSLLPIIHYIDTSKRPVRRSIKLSVFIVVGTCCWPKSTTGRKRLRTRFVYKRRFIDAILWMNERWENISHILFVCPFMRLSIRLCSSTNITPFSLPLPAIFSLTINIQCTPLLAPDFPHQNLLPSLSSPTLYSLRIEEHFPRHFPDKFYSLLAMISWKMAVVVAFS